MPDEDRPDDTSGATTIGVIVATAAMIFIVAIWFLWRS